MMPAIGDIVIYHFTHIGPLVSPSEPVIRTGRCRPAIITGVNHLLQGECDLHVFFAPDDWSAHTTFLAGRANGDLYAIQPHRDAGGEMGEIERTTPSPNTWSWRQVRRGGGG